MRVNELPITALCRCLVFVLLGLAPVNARLASPDYQEEQAKRIIEDIFRETRLNEGTSFWGDQYKTEIDQYTKLFRGNYYQVFGDLNISGAMARCAVSAKYDADIQRWSDLMDQFDRAAKELNEKDQGRYFYAKAMAKMQLFPDKLDEMPAELYDAARNGHPSTIWARTVLKTERRTTGFGNQRMSDALVRFARAYAEGGELEEAFKMHMLAAKAGLDDPRDYLSLIESAADLDEGLAYQCAQLFLEVFSIRDGMRKAQLKVFTYLPLHAAIPAAEFVKACTAGGLRNALAESARANANEKESDEPIKPRNVERFDTRYAQNIVRFLGSRDDLFEIDICLKYWSDSAVVNRFMERVDAGIDEHDGRIGAFADKLRKDPRFAQDPSSAYWESRRWKAAGRLDEFAQRFPERAALAQSVRNRD